MIRNLLKALQPPSFRPIKPVVLFDFSKEETLKQFRVASDKDFFGGYSTAKAEHHSDGFVRFQGNLSTLLPMQRNTGQTVEQSGFCLMRSLAGKPSLFGQSYMNLGGHNALEFVVRGDGRGYIANIQSSSLHEEDLYQAFLYTRGGPHWQTIRIPLSEFYLTHLGYIQNEQKELHNERVRTLGVLLADRTDGPFQLDIKEIRAISLLQEETRQDATGVTPTAQYDSADTKGDKVGN